MPGPDWDTIFSAVPLTSTGAEVKQDQAYLDSFLWVPTAGVRSAPEELVLELFREVYFGANHDHHSPMVKTLQALRPSGADTPSAADAAIYALRGRAKKKASARRPKHPPDFYAPAYPALAANAWFRSQADAALRSLFIEGALANSLPIVAFDLAARGCGAEVAEAIAGISGGPEDILFLAAGRGARPDGMKSTEDAADHVTRLLIGRSSVVASGPSGVVPDPLAVRIAGDWAAICALEPRVPRAEWIQVLKAYLGVACAVWLLAQMRMTILTRDLFLGVLAGQPVPAHESIQARFHRRFEGLIEPGSTPCNPMPIAVSAFMKARVELNTLLHAARHLPSTSKLLSAKARLSLHQGSDRAELVDVCEALRADLSPAEGQEMITRIRRKAESAKAWCDPTANGTTGKNLDEFLLVLTDDSSDSIDNGSLLQRVKTNRRLYRVFPATRLLSLFSFLAGWRANGSPLSHVPLAKLEEQFAGYGIDFRRVGGARRDLMLKLEKLGLLSGVPDAGAAVAITVEYAGLWPKGEVA